MPPKHIFLNSSALALAENLQRTSTPRFNQPDTKACVDNMEIVRFWRMFCDSRTTVQCSGNCPSFKKMMWFS